MGSIICRVIESVSEIIPVQCLIHSRGFTESRHCYKQLTRHRSFDSISPTKSIKKALWLLPFSQDELEV